MTWNPVAKTLIAGGAILVVAGVCWQFGGRFLPLGKLPGDISVEKENFRFYFPFATCLLLSAVLTLVVWVIRSFWGNS